MNFGSKLEKTIDIRCNLPSTNPKYFNFNKNRAIDGALCADAISLQNMRLSSISSWRLMSNVNSSTSGTVSVAGSLQTDDSVYSTELNWDRQYW